MTLALDPSDRITATIPEFRRLSGIGRSRIYELLDAGEIVPSSALLLAGESGLAASGAG